MNDVSEKDVYDLELYRKIEKVVGQSLLKAVSEEEIHLRRWLEEQVARKEDSLDYLLYLKEYHQPMPWQPGYQERLWNFVMNRRGSDDDHLAAT